MGPLFQKQAFLHRPDQGTYGDCHRTCIASLLGINRDDVPHWGVHYNDPGRFDAEAEAFLASKGLRALSFPIHCETPQEARDWMSRTNPGMYYLMTGQSRNGTNHVVICKDSLQVWDPAIDDSGIVTGCDESCWYWIDVLVPNTELPAVRAEVA